MEKIGIIGVGNMGGAIATSLCEKGKKLVITNRSSNKLEKYRKYENAEIVNNNKEVVEKSKYIILAVKPNMYKNVIEEIKDYFTEDKIFISIAAGFTVEKLEKYLPLRKIFMTMPNTPVMAGEGMCAIVPNKLCTEEDRKEIISIFNEFGRCSLIEEKEFNAFAAACGCLPAYVYMFIEAAADSAVLNGMNRKDAYNAIAQTVLGSAKMVLKTGKHPGELKDMVTSPGGTTIEGVKYLEENGFRGSIIGAINAAADKGKNM